MKVPLGCTTSMEYLQLFYGQGQAPSSLAIVDKLLLSRKL